jgi:hypothetical protein
MHFRGKALRQRSDREPREALFHYKIRGIHVCKEFFLHLLGHSLKSYLKVKIDHFLAGKLVIID